MNIVKVILIIIGLLTAGLAGYLLVGLIFSLFWYAIILGLLGAVAYGGYKMFKRNDAHDEIEGGQPTAIAGMENADRVLEEYKRKSLTK